MKNKSLKWCRLSGGPWAGKASDIPSNGTLVFSLKGFHGWYNGQGDWVDVPKPGATTFMAVDEWSKFEVPRG
jgi:hypothetical protein